MSAPVPPVPRRILVALIGVLAALCPLPAGASAATAPDLQRFTDGFVRSTLATVGSDGWIADPTQHDRADAYGSAGFGYAGLRAADRAHDPQLMQRAIHAVLYSVRQRHALPFDQWLVAKSYRWADQHLRDEPAWTAIRGEVAAYLDDPPMEGASANWRSDFIYNNWKLVELSATATARAAGRYPLDAARRKRIATITALAGKGSGGPATQTFVRGSARAMSDPSAFPMAYSAFSAAQLVQTRAADASLLTPGLSTQYGDLQRYLLAVAAPDGTVAWSGRSMLMSWTLASAMTVGIRAGGVDGTGLANAAWTTLRDGYGVRPDGFLAIAPSMREHDTYDGVDEYAGLVVYGGLTAALLNDAADALGTRTLRGGPPSAQRNGTVWDPTGAGIAAEHRGKVWWGATTRASSDDVRWVPGLQQVKLLVDGRWVDVLPARPPAGADTSLWPRPPGCAWKAERHDLLRCAGGRTLRIAATATGVRIALRVRPNELVSGRFYLPAPRAASPTTVRWNGGSLRSSVPTRLTVGRSPLASATDVDLRAATYAARADARGDVAFVVGR